MALIPCPECKREISDRAQACPHCGLPAAYFVSLAPGANQAGRGGGSVWEDDALAQPALLPSTLHNLLIAFDRDYQDVFGVDKYISAHEQERFFNTYGSYLPAMLRARSGKGDHQRLDMRAVKRFVAGITSFAEDVVKHNEEFVERKLREYKDYLDNLLKEIDPSVKLDEEQRRAVITDDNHCLLVAGAGAGKTTTMAAKVKYLVEKQNVRPDDIIVISYTNKAIEG